MSARTVPPLPVSTLPAQPGETEPAGSTPARRIAVALGGLIVLLAVVGQIFYLAGAARSGALTTARPIPATGSPLHRLTEAVANALGAGDRGVPRVGPLRIVPDPAHRGDRIAGVTWALNNAYAAGTVGNGAAIDVYTLTRDILTAHLKVSQLQLTATYPLAAGRGRRHETVVLRLTLDRRSIRTVQSMGWDALDPQTLWPLLHQIYLNPAVQPLPSDG